MPASLGVAGPLHGSRGSRRPRRERQLLSEDEPRAGISSHLLVPMVNGHTQSTGQHTQREECKAFPVIFNPTKHPKPELHLGSHNLLTTEYRDLKKTQMKKNSFDYLTLGEEEREFPQQYS